MAKLWRRAGSPPLAHSGHGDELGWGGFSGDSKFMVSGSQTTVIVRALPKATVVRTLEIRPSRAFVRGRKLLAVTPTDDDRRILVQRWPLEAGEPESLGIWESPKRGTGASTSDEQHLWEELQGRNVWDIDPTGKRLLYSQGSDLYVLSIDELETATPQRVGGGGASIVSALFHPDGGRVITVDASSVIRMWSLSAQSGVPVRTFFGLPKSESERDVPRHILRFDPGGSWMVSVNIQDRTTYLWDLSASSGAEPTVLRRGGQPPFGLAVHQTGAWIAVADIFTVSLWPLSRNYSLVLARSAARIVSVAFDPEGRWLISSSWDGTIRRWSHSGEDHEQGKILFDAGEVLVNFMCLSPDGQRVAAGLFDGRVVVVPISGGPARELTGFGSAVWAVAFDPTGRQVAAGGGEKSKQDAVIRIWDLQDGGEQVLDAGDGVEIGGVEFLADGRLLVWNQEAGLRLWDVETGTFELLVPGAVGWLGALSPDGRHVLGSRLDEVDGSAEVFVYDLQEKGLRILSSHGDAIFWVGWHPSGQQVLSGDRNGIVRAGPVTGEEPHLLFGHEGFVGGGAVHPDGHWIASAGIDGTVRLWPMPRGQPFHALPHEELLKRLRSLTNYRVLADPEAATGYRLEYGPLPGWKEVPAW
jgi:WD40 repeat protein